MRARHWFLIATLGLLAAVGAWWRYPVNVVWFPADSGWIKKCRLVLVYPDGATSEEGLHMPGFVYGAAPAQFTDEAITRRREEEKERIINLVASESIEASVAALKESKFSRYFSPRICSIGHNAPGSVSGIVEEIRKDPRVEKLMKVAQEGAPEEKQRLSAALRQEMDLLLQPKFKPTGNGYAEPMNHGPQQSVAIPLLMAAASPDRDMLAVLVQAARAHAELNPDPDGMRIYPLLTLYTGDIFDTLCYAIDACIWQLTQQEGSSDNPTEAALLTSYRQVHQEYLDAATGLLREMPAEWWFHDEPKEAVMARLDALPLFELRDVVPTLPVALVATLDGANWPCAPQHFETCVLEFGNRIVAAQ